MGEGPDLQGELEEATTALRAALDQVAALVTALNMVGKLAAGGLELWEREGTCPVAELAAIGQLARDVVWTPAKSGPPDPESF